MLEKISLRDVGNEQIYDSYMGILRISPTQLDGQLSDSMSLFLTNPVENSGAQRSVILSDSDGIKLGLSFTTKVRSTSVKNLTTGASEKQNVINVVTNTSNMFASQSFNNRSTLVVNKEKQTDKISPIQIYHESQSTIGTFDVLNYPIDSPNDDTYFNAGNKLKLIDYTSSKNVHDQLVDALYQKPKSWYDTNIKAEHRVKVAGNFVYTQNKDYEQVPVVYTKDFVLGHYDGHTARVTPEIKTKFVGTSVGPDRLNEKSLITKLSFINFDQMVWDIIDEATSGNLRQCDGRYNLLGIGENDSICERLFGQVLPPQQYAPILGAGVSPGIVMNHVMPFRRYIFHVLRQEIRNSADEENNYANLRQGVKDYVTQGKITPIAKRDPGFVNPLTKEFVLCDGRELTYDNYPSVNTDNTSMFQHDSNGIVLRNSSTKKPTAVNANDRSDIYKAIAASNSSNAPDGSTNKVMVPSLLPMNQQSPRYLRGLNWEDGNVGLDQPIDFVTNNAKFNYQHNQRKYEVVKGSEYGVTEKDYSDPGNYRMQADWKAVEQKHRHECFYDSESYNRENNSSNKFGDIGDNQPNNWSIESIPNDRKTMLMNYSFKKNQVVNSKHIPNSWDKHTPVPYAALFAWKATTANTAGSSESTSDYYMQNATQEAISSNATERFKQLERINFSEGSAPIAARGGTTLLRGKLSGGKCAKKRKALHHKPRYRWSYQGYKGGYNILKVTSKATDDIPRCVTSLPIENIDKEKEVYEPPYTMKIGDQTVTPDMTLSFPPTTVLLPLFKI